MMRQLSLAFMFAALVYGQSVVFAPPALAVNCDVNACISVCSKKCPTPGCMCASNCLQTIEARKKAKQCK
jgi:hypothetical protein